MPHAWLPVLLFAASASALSIDPPLFGCIRWDAFVNSSSPGTPSGAGAAVARVLQPLQWHDRLPWYTEFTAGGNVTFDGSSAGVMAAEIALAVAAGIDHWVFDMYEASSDLSAALHAYLNATGPAKDALSFCLLLQGASGQALPYAQVPVIAAHFARREYRTVLGNRPLLHLFGPQAGDFSLPGWQGWARALAELAAAAAAAGRGAPYVVFQSASPAAGLEALRGINAAAGAPLVAALSSYYLPGATPAPGTPFADFARAAPGFWDALAATGADVVVPVAAGWDNRPRNMTPVPWEPYVHPDYVIMPAPDELGAFVGAAVAWDAAHAAANPARLALLSAWNEYDEGHWVAPVLPQFGGNARLEAIGRVLRPGGAKR